MANLIQKRCCASSTIANAPLANSPCRMSVTNVLGQPLVSRPHVEAVLRAGAPGRTHDEQVNEKD